MDEVLAVGDAQFQNKCLGKMDTAGQEGRTVLFVSHNMQAIKQLCPRSILLCAGRVEVDATSSTAIQSYIPVSYTHLDVYKRQVQLNMRLPCSFVISL